MGKETGIQWCDSTVNPTTGCDGCELWTWLEAAGRALGPCYAGNQHEGRLALAMPKLYAPSFTEVRLIPGRMAKAAAFSDLTGTKRPDKPWLDGMPRVVFVEDMGDLFSKAVPFEYIHEEVLVAATSKKGSRHIYMILTKQGRRLASFAGWLAERGIPWPDNVWPGVSITRKASLTRIDGLLKVPAKVRYLSVEPLWEAVDLRPYLTAGSIGLVIVGGESEQSDEHVCHPFDLRWARDVVRDCREFGVSPFVKQLGAWATDEKNGVAGARLEVHPDAIGLISRRLKDPHGGDWSEWPEDLRIRELPAVATEMADA